MSDTPAPLPSGSIVYSFRLKPFSNPLDLTLNAHDLHAEKGRSEQRFPLRAVESIRLLYVPRNARRHSFRCELRATDGKSVAFDSISWKSLVDVEEQGVEYTRFVAVLVARIHAAGRRPKLITGIATWRYAGMKFGGYAVLAALGGASLYAGWKHSLVTAAGGLALAAYFWHWLNEYLRRNRPGQFEPGAIPPEVLP